MSETSRQQTRTLRSVTRKIVTAGTTSRRARAAMLGMAMGVTALGSATATARDAQLVRASKPVSAKKHHHWFEIGKATWYGGDFDGRKTADGEIYNENAFTCAHRTLPLGSWIRVTNLRNNRSAIVRVTDRGPWVKDAVLDLSHAAARRLGFSGTAEVRIDRVERPELAQQRLEAPQQQLAQLDFPRRRDTISQQ